MGTETAETPEVSTKEELAVTEPIVEDERLNAGDDSEADGKPQEPPEVEIVLDGDDGSQPHKQHGIQKRVNKLNDKVAKAEGKATDATNELALERERNKLLRLALEQKAPVEVPTPPDPVDYDEGVRDPKYVNALNAYNQPMIAAEVQKQTASLTPVQADVVDPALVKKQTKHYERAEELGAKDFDEVEDKAIEILGKEAVNQLIKGSDESHLILYYLGKNPEKAKDIAKLIKEDAVRGVLQLGRLSAQLSVKPRANSEPTPDPDEELQGGSPAAAKSNKFQRKLDKAREDAQDGGSGRMQAIADIKKEAIEAGFTVI
jgi:hypothetical protein